jgi:dTDP-4-dehydrorhamnose reductase
VFSTRQGSYVNKVLEWAKSRKALRVVTDQTSSPTWARNLAEATTRVLDQFTGEKSTRPESPWGLYHVAGSDFCTRYDWAKQILELAAQASGGASVDVHPALSSEFATPANRPGFSALDCSKFEKTFGFHLPDWKTATRLAMNN